MGGRFRQFASLLIISALALNCGGGDKKIPDPPAPVAPTGLVLNALSSSQIEITWSDVSGEDHYRVERSDDFGATFIQVGFLNADTTIFNDQGLLPFTLYTYQVTAINRGGSAVSAQDSTLTMDLVWDGPMSATPPGARSHHSAVYDSAGQRMLVYGGATPSPKSDLWALDLSNPGSLVSTDWSLLSPAPDPLAGAPPAMAGHTAIYDAQNNRMILFGGQSSAGFLNDVWVLSFSAPLQWRHVVPPGTVPVGRRDHTAVYDSTRQEMIIYGGVNYNLPNVMLTDFNVLALTPDPASFFWVGPLPVGAQPAHRFLHSAIYDPAEKRMIAFGGTDNDSFDNSALSAETWNLFPSRNYDWDPGLFLSTPTPRQGQSAVLDSFNRKMVVFGGGDDVSAAFNPPEYWCLNLGLQPSWVKLLPSNPGPVGIQSHTAVYDALNRRMVIYGGERDLLTPVADVWTIQP